MIKGNQPCSCKRLEFILYLSLRSLNHLIKQLFDLTKHRHKYYVNSFLYSLFLPYIAFAADEPRIYELEKQRTSAFTYINDINIHGQITGYGNHGFLWDNGTQKIVTPNSYWSETTAINDSGQIVGMAAPGPNSTQEPGKAFVWDRKNGLKFIDVPGKPWSFAQDLNNNGVVVGLSTKEVFKPNSLPQTESEAFVWSEDTGVTFIKGFGGTNTVALGINNSESSIVVGASQTIEGLYQAYRWTRETGAQQLETAVETQSFATSVNDSGTAVGWVGEPPFSHWSWFHNYVRDEGSARFSGGPWTFSTLDRFGQAVKWQNGKRIDLGTLPGFKHSVALDINNQGLAVGYASPEDYTQRKAIIIGPDNVITDLNDIFYSNQIMLEVATAINDEGVIIAWGRSFISENPQDFRPYILALPGKGHFSDLMVELFPSNYTDSSTRPKIGEQLKYRTQVTNFGSEASNVMLTYKFTAGVDAISYPTNCSYNQNILTCQLGQVNANTGDGLEITVQLSSSGRQFIELLLNGDHTQINPYLANTSAEIYVEQSPIPSPRYLLTDLGPTASGANLDQQWNRPFSQAYGLNENGTVVGRIDNLGFIYQDGQWTILKENCSFESIPCITGSQWQELSAINNNDTIVGISGSQHSSKGLLLDTSLIPVSFGESQNYAREINDLGHIAGFSTMANPAKYSHAYFLNNDGILQFIDGLGGLESYALGINNNNQIVGSAGDSNNVMRAFIWDATTGTRQINLPINEHSFATALNDNGDIVGWFGNKPERVNWSLMFGSSPNAGPSAWYYKATRALGNAFVHYQGKFRDLGPGLTYDINNKGLAVGYWRSPSLDFWDSTLIFPRQIFYHGAFLYDSIFNQFFFLDDVVISDEIWSLRVASAINDRGQIVGWGEVNDETRAFLLIPDPNQEKADLVVSFEKFNNVAGGNIKFTLANQGPNTSDIHFRQEITAYTTVNNLPTECTKDSHAIICLFTANNSGESHIIEYNLSNTDIESYNSDVIVYGSIWDQDSTNNKVSVAIKSTPNQCNGDFDNDGDVDGTDLSVFSSDFDKLFCSGCQADFDNDGDVDGSDLSRFSNSFGRIDCLL